MTVYNDIIDIILDDSNQGMSVLNNTNIDTHITLYMGNNISIGSQWTVYVLIGIGKKDVYIRSMGYNYTINAYQNITDRETTIITPKIDGTILVGGNIEKVEGRISGYAIPGVGSSNMFIVTVSNLNYHANTSNGNMTQFNLVNDPSGLSDRGVSLSKISIIYLGMSSIDGQVHPTFLYDVENTYHYAGSSVPSTLHIR